MFTIHTKSEVELNKDKVVDGMTLYYTDASNFQRWVVTEVTEDYFSAVDDDDMEETFFFEELQFGWSF